MKDKSQLALSKSKYCGLWQCPKIAWMRKYKPDELDVGDEVIARMKAGKEVNDLAKGLFGEYTDVTIIEDDRPDIPEMIRRTKMEMSNGTPVICEASFDYNGLYCAVDILKNEGDGWAIYEVKSSVKHKDGKDDRPEYIADVAYQKYVLESCGVKVTGTYLVQLNKEYVFDGTLDIQQLFAISDIKDDVALEEKNITANLLVAERLLDSPDEPDIDLSVNCNKPYPCAFWKYCARDIPSPSVFDLYRLNFDKKISFYSNGQISFEDLINDPKIKNEKQLRQMEYAMYDKGTYVDKDNIREFLGRLSYPLYFLDFETMQPAIPEFIGTRPYTQIPFQYSLHYIEEEGGELYHKEFLAESGTDPRRAIAESLCENIPKNVCVTAYYKAFECSRLKELAETFPDLAEHLLNIRDNIVDLLEPFQSGWYYNRAMGGSFSIKSVLPAIFPDDPELDYHNLEDVHNGTEAMTLFPKLESMPPEEQAEARRNLLAYCRLDTLAMVRVWEKLREI